MTDTDLTAAFEPGRGQPQVPATATPVPVPTATPVPEAPTPTPLSTAALSGLVKPPQSGVRIAFLDLPLETTTGGDGAYAIVGVPLGEHFLFAMDSKGQVSDTYRVSLNAAQVALNIDLQEFKPGSPGLFVGHIVNASGAPVSGATVWRVGGAGRTTSEAQGLFRLVDTFADGANPKPPDKLSIVAVSGDRWGVQSFDFSSGPNKNRLEVKLTRQGSAPVPPKRVSDFKSTLFEANSADAFTARWPNNGVDLIAVDVVDKDGKALASTLKSTQCMGECDGFDGSALSIKLPRDVPFRLVVHGKNGGDPAKPGWDEAQLVSLK